MRFNVARHWYRTSFLSVLLLPLAGLFYLGVQVRRLLYRLKIKKSLQFKVPVIIVGNITVGGTGKTPFVIALANLLSQQGYQPGIVSRGVGSKTHTSPLILNSQTTAQQAGDEAVLMARRSGCPVVVCADRPAAVMALLAHSKCNIIISDDGLQHYRLGRQLEIAMLDGMRGLGNHYMLPAGPLREPRSRLKTVDFVVKTSNEKKPSTQEGYSVSLHGDKLVSLIDETNTISFSQINASSVHAVAGIGNPQRFFAMLRSQGFNIIEHEFPDHHTFKKTDFSFPDNLPIIMTEKDQVKCTAFADERMWYLPITVEINAPLAAELLQAIRAFCLPS